MATSRAPFVLSASADPANWTVADAEKLYNMPGWGLGFFRANAEGHVTVHPDGAPDQGLDLYQLAIDLKAQGVGLPLLLRFSDILRARIAQLAEVFREAIGEFGYKAATPRSTRSRSTSSGTWSQEIVEFGARARRGTRVRLASRSCRRSSACTRAPST